MRRQKKDVPAKMLMNLPGEIVRVKRRALQDNG
jgi:hypothetical protein